MKLWQEYVDKLQPSIRMSYIRKPILDDLKKVHMNPKYEFEPNIKTGLFFIVTFVSCSDSIDLK